MSNALPVVAAIVLSLIGVVADVFIKKAGTGDTYVDYRWFITGLLIYAATAFGWFYVMKELKLGTTGVLYSVSTVLFLVLAGFFFFGEHLSVYEWIGVGCAIVSITLMVRFA